MSKPIPSLPTLRVLETITSALAKEKANLTATRLKRDHSIDDAVFWEASEYGCRNKFIKLGSQNYHSLIRDFTIPESAYYEALIGAVERLWLREGYEESDFYVEDTSSKDAKVIGPWVRPDFTMVSHKKFPWTIGNEFDVITFEAKRPDSANVLAVFEALSHATAATRAYTIFPMSLSDWEQTQPRQAERVRDECSRHGVGLILVDDILGTTPVATHVIRASRRQIDHEKCSSFLEAVISAEGRAKIARWK
jgi:hypothetical protein